MEQLKDFRKSIDLIDNSIINLLAKRFRVVKKVGLFKKKKGIPPLDKKRWEEVLNSKMAKAKALGLDPKLVERIYNIIHEFALQTEKRI